MEKWWNRSIPSSSPVTFHCNKKKPDELTNENDAINEMRWPHQSADKIPPERVAWFQNDFPVPQLSFPWSMRGGSQKRERDTEKEVSGSDDPFSLWPLPSVFLFRGVAHFRGIRQTPCWRWNPRQMYWNLIWQSADWGQKSLDGRFRPSILHTTPLIFSWLFLFGWRHVLRCFPFLCSLHPRFIVTLSSRKVSCTFHFRANQRVGQQLCRWCVNRWLGFYGNKKNKTKSGGFLEGPAVSNGATTSPKWNNEGRRRALRAQPSQNRWPPSGRGPSFLSMPSTWWQSNKI